MTDNWIDEIFEVKLDDKQTSYLWAKLSPKSKALIQQKLTAAYDEGYAKGYAVQLRKDNQFIRYIQAEARIEEIRHLHDFYDAHPDYSGNYITERVKELSQLNVKQQSIDQT